MDRSGEALCDSEFDEITPELARLALDWFHRLENIIESSDSWYDTSCRDHLEYWACSGDRLLNWKDKGYAVVFDLLQVSMRYLLRYEIDAIDDTIDAILTIEKNWCVRERNDRCAAFPPLE